MPMDPVTPGDPPATPPAAPPAPVAPHGLLQNQAVLIGLLLLGAIALMVYAHFAKISVGDATVIVLAAVSAVGIIYKALRSILDNKTMMTRMWVNKPK